MNHLARNAVVRGMNYLQNIQGTDGAWRDFRLPVGVSDQWVTAFTGVGLVEAATCFDVKTSMEASERAVEFLKTQQGYECGWGYNRHTGIDADSTAHAILLQRKLGHEVRDDDERCLMKHWRKDGGFCTYLLPSQWGKSHPDVTAAAGLALSDTSLANIRCALLKRCDAWRMKDKSWPTYWWRNHAYGTCYMLQLYARLGLPQSISSGTETVRVDSCFDFAWAIGCLTFSKISEKKIKKAIENLCLMQEPCGRWPGSLSLRVTNPECRAPWESSSGKYYEDENATITTASVLRAISLCVSRKAVEIKGQSESADEGPAKRRK
jgi:hypothetical protein